MRGVVALQTGRMRRGALALLASLTLPLAACGRTQQAGSVAPPAHILDTYLAADPVSLAPTTAKDEASFDVLNQLYEGLTRLDADGRPTPAIAASWDVADGGKTYTFHLRQASWSDGQPVTADDFAYAWKRALDPRSGSEYAYQLRYLQNALPLLQYHLPDAQREPEKYAAAAKEIDAMLARVGVAAQDERTLVVHLEAAKPFWLGLTAFPTYLPIEAALGGRLGDRYGAEPSAAAYDGPFVLKAWVRGGSLDLAKNASYWDAASVHLDGVHFDVVKESSTAVNNYLAGKYGFIQIPADQLAAFRGKPVQTFAQSSVWYLEVNLRKAPLASRLVRQAISDALDREGLARQVVGGGALAAFAYTPPPIHYAPGKAFNDLVGRLLPTAAGPAQAREELAQGLKDLQLDKLPPLVLLGGNTSRQRQQLEALQGFLSQNLGVQVSVRAVDLKSELQQIAQGSFDLALIGWDADYDDPTTFLDLWSSQSPFNDIRWSDTAYDAALQQAAAETDPDKRGAELAAAERELLHELPVIPVYWPAWNYAAHPDVKGLVLHITGPDYDLKWVRLG